MYSFYYNFCVYILIDKMSNDDDDDTNIGAIIGSLLGVGFIIIMLVIISVIG